MSVVLLTVYILMWPALVVAVLLVLVRGVVRDYRDAARNRTTVV